MAHQLNLVCSLLTQRYRKAYSLTRGVLSACAFVLELLYKSEMLELAFTFALRRVVRALRYRSSDVTNSFRGRPLLDFASVVAVRVEASD